MKNSKVISVETVYKDHVAFKCYWSTDKLEIQVYESRQDPKTAIVLYYDDKEALKPENIEEKLKAAAEKVGKKYPCYTGALSRITRRLRKRKERMKFRRPMV